MFLSSSRRVAKSAWRQHEELGPSILGVADDNGRQGACQAPGPKTAQLFWYVANHRHKLGVDIIQTWQGLGRSFDTRFLLYSLSELGPDGRVCVWRLIRISAGWRSTESGVNKAKALAESADVKTVRLQISGRHPSQTGRVHHMLINMRPHRLMPRITPF